MRSFLLEFRDGSRALAPGRFPYLRFAAALTLGTAGGWTFAQFNLPLPWMLGAMTVCTLAALVHAPIAAPAVVRPPMTMVIGVLLGAGFNPAIVVQLPTWIPTILGLAGFVAACAAACVTYFRIVGGFDRTTAFFAGMPGGLVEMAAQTVLGTVIGCRFLGAPPREIVRILGLSVGATV